MITFTNAFIALKHTRIPQYSYKHKKPWHYEYIVQHNAKFLFLCLQHYLVVISNIYFTDKVRPLYQRWTHIL